MTEVSEEMLMAYVDGELDAAGRETVERALAASPTLRDEVERQRALRGTLAAYYAPVAEEEVPERLRAMLGQDAGAPVVDFAAARERRRPRFALPHFAAMAASLAVGVLAAQLALTPDGPVGFEQGAMVARGDLAETLETRLASAQPVDADTRIGLTFEDREGRVCRTFEAPAVSGIACKEAAGWVLAMTAPGGGPAGSDYRQASAPLVVEQAQAMMAGDPLDAAAEALAKARGWRSAAD